jgi:hypothetical protein
MSNYGSSSACVIFVFSELKIEPLCILIFPQIFIFAVACHTLLHCSFMGTGSLE